jgi:hypothetical protein
VFLRIPFPVVVLLRGCLVLEKDTERLPRSGLSFDDEAIRADLLDKIFSLALRILSRTPSGPLISEAEVEAGIGGGGIEGGFGIDSDRLFRPLEIIDSDLS